MNHLRLLLFAFFVLFQFSCLKALYNFFFPLASAGTPGLFTRVSVVNEQARIRVYTVT